MSEDVSVAASGMAGVTVSVGRAIPPVMARSRAVSSVELRITRAGDGTVENREAGSRYGWDENDRPMRVDYELLDGVETIRGWAYIDAGEMP